MSAVVRKFRYSSLAGAMGRYLMIAIVPHNSQLYFSAG
jgi:hypothetical protein